MQQYLLGASLPENFTHIHSQIQDDASDCLSVATSVLLIIRGSEVATERQLWRDITSRQSFLTRDTQATAASNIVSVVLPATTLVNDNSDDKPRHLPLYVNSLDSCLSYEPRGIASVTGYC